MAHFNTKDIRRDSFQLFGEQARMGYDWWWHSFTGYSESTGEEKSFFLEFFTCNPLLGDDKPIFGQMVDESKRAKRPSYLMVKAGAWGDDALQLHRFFGWDKVRIRDGAPFGIKAEDCVLTENRIKGTVSISKEECENHPEWMCDAGEMEFDLEIHKDIAFNVGYGASTPMRKLQLFEMFWHAQGMKTRFKGYVILNGECYIVKPETCYGYSDKNWGKDFTSPWVWLSSNDLYSMRLKRKLTNSVFDIGGGRPKVGPVALDRKLLSAFWYEGKPFEFNFSKFWTGTRTSFECHETEDEIIWHVDQSTWNNRMVTDITCKKKDMLLINYEAPNGLKLHNRLWNGGTGEGTVKLYENGKLLDKVIAKHIGCEYGEYDK